MKPFPCAVCLGKCLVWENVYDHRSLGERVRAAVCSACARRGLALRTKQCFGAWAARLVENGVPSDQFSED